MTAAMIRSANRVLEENQVVQGNIVDFTELGSEGAMLRIHPHPDLAKDMTMQEIHKRSAIFQITRNGDVRRKR